MNILIDAHIFDNKYQGTRTFLKGLYVNLIRQVPEWNFYIGSFNVNSLIPEFGEHRNVHYIKYKHRNKYFRLLFDLPEIARKHKIDYTHFQYIASPFIKGKTIVTTHDILFKEKEFKPYFPLKYRIINGFLFYYSAKRADILTTVSNYSKTRISTLYNIKEDRINVIPNGISTDILNLNENFNNINEKYDLKKYLLYVSRIEPRKNHIILIKAFVELELWTQDLKLVFIGNTDLKDKKLNSYLNSLSPEINSKILWLSNISYEELKWFYKKCSVFIFPSIAEGFGIPPLEAIALKRLVLISDTTAMKDFRFPAYMYFNPFDLQELKAKLTFLLSSQNQFETFNYEDIINRYNWESISSDFHNLLKLHYNSIK